MQRGYQPPAIKVFTKEYRQIFMLEEEEESDDKEEEENSEIEFDNVGELMEVPDPEPTPNKVISSSYLESPIIPLPNLNLNTPDAKTKNSITSPIQIRPSQLINHNTPKLSYFIRPKPWPEEPPKHTENKLRTSSEETRKLTYDEDEASNRGEVSPGSKRQQKRSVGQIRVFPATDQALQWNYHRFRPTLSRAAAAARLTTPFPGENRRRSRPERLLLVIPVENQARNRRCAVVPLLVFDPGGNGTFEEKGFAWLRFWWSFGHFGRIYEGDRRRIEENGRRFSERRRIGIVFEGNRRQIKERSHRFSEKRRIGNGEALGCEFGGDVANFRGESTPDKGGKKIWEFLSNDRLLFVMEEDLGVILVEKVNDLGVVLVEKVKELCVVLMEACTKKEEDLCCVEGRRNEEEKVLGLLSETKRDFVALTLNLKLETVSFCISLLGTRNGGVLKGISVGLVGAARRIGSSTDLATIATGFPYQLMGQLGHYSPLGCIGNYWSAIQWTLGKLVNNRIGPIGPLLQLVTNWATCNWFFHINSLANWVTNSQFQVSILEDKDVFKEKGM